MSSVVREAPGAAPFLAGAGLGLVGLLCFALPLGDLWKLWTSDGLRSIGMLMPPVSLWLAFRGCSHADWGRQGNWWGLPLVAGSIYLANLNYFHPLRVGLAGVAVAPGVALAPIGLTLFAYASGVVLLFAGWRTWRKCAFGLALLLLVNPVPHAWSSKIDLQLQYLGAHTARAFANWIGLPLGGDTIALMFAPHYEVLIGPGCNGLRGTVTMGLLALVAGHLQGLRAHRHALYVAGAVLLAYACNLVRLCLVVLYSALAVRLGPSLELNGALADYLMGAALFAAAVALLLWIACRLGSRGVE